MHNYDEFARKEDMLVEIDASLGMGSGMGTITRAKDVPHVVRKCLRS
jgi:hypothetical protein